MSWYKVSDGRLCYRGRVTKGPFSAWTATPEGQAAVEAEAKKIRFSLMGRSRAAKRRLWRELESVVVEQWLQKALQAEPDHYLSVWAALAYAPSLPRLQVNLRRLVAVPRTMIAARALSGLTARLLSQPAFAALDAPLRSFLCGEVISQMDAALRRAKPSPRRPAWSKAAWACVALDDRFAWVDPLWSGPEWQGHVLLYEMENAIPRRERRELEAAVERLQDSIAGMSFVHRDATVRSASASLTAVRV